jgi:predicted MPP superfamily phosphohydrolase
MKLFKKIAYLSISCLIILLAFSFTVNKGKTEDIKGALNFLIISDWGWNGFKSQQEVADQMAVYAEKTEPKFIISCGDNFQVQGVASAQDPLWISNYENIYKNVSLQVDWYPVLGNHDYKGNTQAEIDY